MSTQLRKYMTAHLLWWKLLTFGALAFCGLFLVSFLLGNDVDFSGLLFDLLLLGLSLVPQIKVRKSIATLESSEMLRYIETDFENAIIMRNDLVRFGKAWIFIKGKQKPLAYRDIRQVYQYVHRTNFIENERKLMYVDQNGKKGTLCKLKLRGKSDADVNRMVSIILNKNPYVKIGYR